MQLCGVCILTDNAPRLAAFYETVFKETPVEDGQHYGFENAQIAVYNPGNVNVVDEKNMSLMFFVNDLLGEYERLNRELPDIAISAPPERRPWGAFSFWFLDLDGNTVSFIEKNDAAGEISIEITEKCIRELTSRMHFYMCRHSLECVAPQCKSED